VCVCAVLPASGKIALSTKVARACVGVHVEALLKTGGWCEPVSGVRKA